MKSLLAAVLFVTALPNLAVSGAITQQAYLKASDTRAGDRFGTGVAVSGNTVVVLSSTAAYIFERNGASWVQQARIAPPTGSFTDGVVALSGETLVIGAPNQGGSGRVINAAYDNLAPRAGAAFIFVRNGNSWSQQAYLKSSNADPGDGFGTSVAITGNTIVVGAPGESGSGTGVNPLDDNNAVGRGAAYVFVRLGAVWHQESYIKARAGKTGNGFGYSVAATGDTAAIGSWAPFAKGLAEVSLFVRQGFTWSLQTTLHSIAGVTSTAFGCSVAISNDTVVVGSDIEELIPNSITGGGAVYVFARSGADWTQQARLTKPTRATFFFGTAVAISEGTIVVGASPNPSNIFDSNVDGAAAVFARNGSTWNEVAFLEASNLGTEDFFGDVVGISGDTIVVGASEEDGSGTGVNPGSNEGALEAGAGYIFVGAGSVDVAPVLKPEITSKLFSPQTVILGENITFAPTFSGSDLTYQWYFNGTAINGVTNSTYTVQNANSENSGVYTVVATNTGGSATSDPTILVVTTSVSNTAYLNNVSIRAVAGSGSQTLIVGFTVGGRGTESVQELLVRGAGPSLSSFGVQNVLSDPEINVYRGSSLIARNDDWTDPQTATKGGVLGAFPLTIGSKDSALVTTLATGGYTVQLTGKGGSSGVGLVEVYDAGSHATALAPRLVNLSARTQVGNDGNILICGFVVGGRGSCRILIRAIGPSLSAFNVPDILSDPKLELYQRNIKVGENDNWSNTDAAVQSSVGAFTLPQNSKDSVLMASVSPGSYTAQVSGVNRSIGVALIEIYEVP